jgi:hypothetical protein
MYIAKLIFISALVISFTDVAEARRRSSKRSGFNFGTTIVSASGSSILEPNESSNKNRNITNSVSGYAPHIGYSFDILAVGLRYTSKVEETKHEEVDANNKEQKSILETTINTSNVSLFTKVNFGKILFMEAGAGLYKQQTKINNQFIVNQANQTFVGEKEEYSLDGLGGGYHTSLGFEVPVGTGFYFTGAMTFTSYAIKSDDKGIGHGDKQASHEDKDLNFGFSYYFN